MISLATPSGSPATPMLITGAIVTFEASSAILKFPALAAIVCGAGRAEAAEAAALAVPDAAPETDGVEMVGTDGMFRFVDDEDGVGMLNDGFEIVETFGKSGTALYAFMSALIPSIAPEIRPLMTLMTLAITSITPPAILPTT
jgi:hypothetical protein